MRQVIGHSGAHNFLNVALKCYSVITIGISAWNLLWSQLLTKGFNWLNRSNILLQLYKVLRRPGNLLSSQARCRGRTRSQTSPSPAPPKQKLWSLSLIIFSRFQILWSLHLSAFQTFVAPSHYIFWDMKWKRQASPPLHCWNWTATPWCPLVVLAWRSEEAGSSSRNHFFSQWLSFNCESRWVYLHVLRRPRRGLWNMPRSSFVNYVIPGPSLL